MNDIVIVLSEEGDAIYVNGQLRVWHRAGEMEFDVLIGLCPIRAVRVRDLSEIGVALLQDQGDEWWPMELGDLLPHLQVGGHLV